MLLYGLISSFPVDTENFTRSNIFRKKIRLRINFGAAADGDTNVRVYEIIVAHGT